MRRKRSGELSTQVQNFLVSQIGATFIKDLIRRRFVWPIPGLEKVATVEKKAVACSMTDPGRTLGLDASRWVFSSQFSEELAKPGGYENVVGFPYRRRTGEVDERIRLGKDSGPRGRGKRSVYPPRSTRCHTALLPLPSARRSVNRPLAVKGIVWNPIMIIGVWYVGLHAEGVGSIYSGNHTTHPVCWL